MANDLDPKYYFEDLEDGAKQLIETLPFNLLSENATVIIAVSQEGVFFADKIAKALNVPMDILLTEPILAGNNSELAVAMISEIEEVVIHKALTDAFEIDDDYIYNEAKRKYEDEILTYVQKYRKGEPLRSLKGKYVVLVDECIETALTMMVSLKSVIAKEAKNIYIATPILEQSVYENLLSVSDSVFCPHKIQDYISIEYYYKNFEPLTFEEIETIVEAQIHTKKNEEIQGTL